MEELYAKDPMKKIPDHYVIAVRLCMLMRGIGVLLKQPPVSLANVWLSQARDVVNSYEAKNGVVHEF